MQQDGKARPIEVGSQVVEIAAERLHRQAAELEDTAKALRRKGAAYEAEDLEAVAESLEATAKLLATGLVKPEPRQLRVVGGKGHAIPDDVIRDAIIEFGDEPFTGHELARRLKIGDATAKRKITMALERGWCGEAGFRQLGPWKPAQLFIYKRPEKKTVNREGRGHLHHLNGLDPAKVTEHVHRGAPVELGGRPKHAWPDVERIFQAAEEAGFTVSLPKGGGHWKVLAPDGRVLFGVSNTPPSRQSLIKIRHDFRKAGAPV